VSPNPRREPLAGRGRRLVAVVAHPDDETFGCGSLLAQAADDGAHVTVICATRGERGERRPDPATDHRPLAEVREDELVAAAAALGVDEVVVLGHLDSSVMGDLDPGALCATPVEDLARELLAHLVDQRPDVVLALDGSDGHRDHLHVYAALQEAVAGLPTRPPLVLASLANSLMRRWVAEMQLLNPETVYLDTDVALLGRPDDELTAIDVAPWLPVIERAIACHRSQRSPFDGLTPELRRAFLATAYVQFV
jgi:N-acetyl-1-D-myo-inositol-2-amino-2-deoxy-alpha-D-glucopyranoside deacetylase